ncbi:MAG: ABC transporter substrate-binding protein [Rhodospirillales bacterium]|nr:ABC transporter substrate-binding protein [Rhodospirillales bacterium]
MTGSAPRLLRRRQALAGGLAALSLPLPFVSARAAAVPIRIGFGVPLSSPYAEEALEMVRGATAAVAMFNDAGGLNGRRADLLVRDFRLNAKVATAGTEELIKTGIDLMSGGLSPGVMLAINAVTRKHKIPFNAISQSDTIVAAPVFAPTTFHEGPTPHMSSQALGEYAFPQFGGRVAFLAVDYAVGKELVSGFKLSAAKHGVTSVAEIYHPLGTTDFTPYLQKIAAAKPTIVVFCNYGPDQQFAIQQATWMGLKKSAKLAAAVISMTARLAAGPEAYQDVIGSTSYYWKLEDTIPSANRFNRLFRGQNGGSVPTGYAALGFAAPLALLTAARKAGSVAAAKLVPAMERLHDDLYKGPEYYRACDHQAVQPLYIVESRYTVDVADRDVFSIVKTVPASESLLKTCAAEGHK